MEKKKSHEKGKIGSFSSEKVFQSWRKKRRDEYNDADDDETVFQNWSKKRRDEYDCKAQKSKRYGKDKAWSLSSERRFENTRTDEMEKGKRTEIGMLLINNDVLEEIVMRLPLKSLLRFQIVSKHWRRTIKSSSFKERHMLHQKTLEPKILCFYRDENRCDTLKTMRLDWSCSSSSCLVEEGPARHIEPIIKKSVRVSNSCDGLLCIFYKDILTTPIIVTNPAMGKSQTLPLSMIQQQYLDKKMSLPKVFPKPGFGKDSVTGTYKLVWLHDHPTNKISLCEVFDFEVKKWRCVTMDTPYEILSAEKPIFVKGLIYWLTENCQILGYNLHTEMFRVITHRILSQPSSRTGLINICSLNDHLWITDMEGVNGIQDFWRIKNVLELDWEWEKMFSIDSTLISPWFPNENWSLPNLTLTATSKDNKKVLISKFCSSKLIQLLPHPTSLVFLSIFSGPYNSEFIPYFQSLDFPL